MLRLPTNRFARVTLGCDRLGQSILADESASVENASSSGPPAPERGAAALVRSLQAKDSSRTDP